MAASSIGEIACTYAALILHDDGIPITSEKILTVVQAANLTIESYWAPLFAKLLEKRSVDDLILSVGSGGGGATVAVSAGPAAGTGGGAAPAAARFCNCHFDLHPRFDGDGGNLLHNLLCTRSSNRSHVLVPSPHGDFLVVMWRTLVGILTGPFTVSRLSFALLTRSSQTFSRFLTFLEDRVIRIRWSCSWGSSSPNLVGFIDPYAVAMNKKEPNLAHRRRDLTPRSGDGTSKG